MTVDGELQIDIFCQFDRNDKHSLAHSEHKCQMWLQVTAQNVTHIMWRTQCDTHNVTHIIGDQDDTDREATKLGKHIRLKAQKMNEHSFKT